MLELQSNTISVPPVLKDNYQSSEWRRWHRWDFWKIKIPRWAIRDGLSQNKKVEGWPNSQNNWCLVKRWPTSLYFNFLFHEIIHFRTKLVKCVEISSTFLRSFLVYVRFNYFSFALEHRVFSFDFIGQDVVELSSSQIKCLLTDS